MKVQSMLQFISDTEKYHINTKKVLETKHGFKYLENVVCYNILTLEKPKISSKTFIDNTHYNSFFKNYKMPVLNNKMVNDKLIRQLSYIYSFGLQDAIKNRRMFTSEQWLLFELQFNVFVAGVLNNSIMEYFNHLLFCLFTSFLGLIKSISHLS